MNVLVFLVSLQLMFQLSSSNVIDSTEPDSPLKSELEHLVRPVEGEEFEDAILTPEQLITKYGYPVEVHTVLTEDGYLLTVHRIPREGATPAYFFHGILVDAASAVFLGTEKGIGYVLYDAGYDVWLANARGTRYSRKHQFLNPDGRQFWDFTFHEFGMYDIPNTVDYILKRTGFSRLHYIGYSQGTTAFWIMCSERPEYRKKIIMMNALAPVGAIPHTTSPILKSVAYLTRNLNFTNLVATKLIGSAEFLPNPMLTQVLSALMCQDAAQSSQALCASYLFLVGGYDSKQLNETSIPVVLGHTPAGTAIKEGMHYMQTVTSGKFRQYDYGIIGNIKRYRRPKPPLYDLSMVTVPVVLYYGENDVISPPVDVLELARQMPNVKAKYLIPDPLFNHLDFMLAIDIRTLVYDRLLEEMRKRG